MVGAVTLDMSAAAVARLIHHRCPALGIDAIVPLGEGDFCKAYLVNGGWVFRLAKHAEAQESLRREACLLPSLATHLEVQIPCPGIVCVAGEACAAFVAHPLVPGPPLTLDRYSRLGEPERDRCTAQVARFLMQMQALELRTALGCGVPVLDYRARYSAALARARDGLFDLLTGPDRAYVERAIREYLESEAPSAFRPCLLHGDLSPEHVRYDEQSGAVSGIIDFGDMAIGDPAWDLVFIYEDYGLDFLRRLLGGYAGGDRAALLHRVYRLWELDAIDWAVRCRAAGSEADRAEALAQLSGSRVYGEQRCNELLRVCGAA